MRGHLRVILLTFIAVSASCVRAAPVVYTESVLAQGSLGTQEFYNLPLVLMLFADTANVVPSPSFPGDLQNIGSSATVQISGIGSAAFTGQIGAFVDRTSLAGSGIGVVGITDLTVNLDILDTFSPAFLSYDLASSIGPITGLAFINLTRHFGTTAGDLVLQNVGGPSTFLASVAVPEPETFMMLAIGLGLLCCAKRRSQHP